MFSVLSDRPFFLNGPCILMTVVQYERKKRERELCIPISFKVHACLKVEVGIPELIVNETRQEQTGGQFPNWRDRDKTTFYGPIAQENPGKIQEIRRKMKKEVKMSEEDKMSKKDKSILTMLTRKLVGIHNKGERVCAS